MLKRPPWLMSALLPLVGWVLVGGAPPARTDDDGPGLRETNYVALLGSRGKAIQVQLRTHRRSPAYADELNYTLINHEGDEVARGNVPLDASRPLAAIPTSDGLCVLELQPGFNAVYVASGETPSAYVASDLNPLRMIGPVPRLYFFVPAGCSRFNLDVVAAVAGEGVRMTVFAPDGRVVKEEEGDFDARATLRVEVPREASEKVWSLSLTRPKDRRLHLDKVVLALDPAIPPYLSKRADWAEAFGTRRPK